jgi:hypothetical protein
VAAALVAAVSPPALVKHLLIIRCVFVFSCLVTGWSAENVVAWVRVNGITPGLAVFALAFLINWAVLFFIATRMGMLAALVRYDRAIARMMGDDRHRRR